MEGALGSNSIFRFGMVFPRTDSQYAVTHPSVVTYSFHASITERPVRWSRHINGEAVPANERLALDE